MVYQYSMIQVPPTVSVREKDYKGREAAEYLEQKANVMAEDGWEFYRVDSVGVQIQPGCLGALQGKSTAQEVFYVITFRRPRSDAH